MQPIIEQKCKTLPVEDFLSCPQACNVLHILKSVRLFNLYNLDLEDIIPPNRAGLTLCDHDRHFLCTHI